MIEFSGEVSEKCRRYVIRRVQKYSAIAMLIPALVFSIPLIVLSITWHWAFATAIIALVFAVIMAVLSPIWTNPALMIPSKVFVYDTTITAESAKFNTTIPIDQVKKIVDYGEWYHILFNYSYRNNHYICQKNLITQGTIEEFERIFQDKIVLSTTK